MRDTREIMTDLAATGLTPAQMVLVVELTTAVAATIGNSNGFHTDSTTENRRAYDRERYRLRVESRRTPPDSAVIQKPPLLLEDKNLKKEKRERATRIPTEWKVSERGRTFALNSGMPAIRIPISGQKFKNHWTAKSGANATKLDWEATWENWVIGDLERAGITAPAPPPDPNLPPMHLRPPWMLEGITEAEWEARRMEMIKGLKNGHDKKPEVRGNTAVGQGGHNDAPKLRFEG